MSLMYYFLEHSVVTQVASVYAVLLDLAWMRILRMRCLISRMYEKMRQ